MRSLFEMGMRKGLGQMPGPINIPAGGFAPVMTTPSMPAPPPAPERPGSTPRVIDEETRMELLAIIKASKADRNRIAAWWEATPKAREVLGDKLSLYSQYLTMAMTYQNLADTLEYRLSQGPGVYIKDYEIEDLRKYQEAVQKLVEVVEGKAVVPPAPPELGSPKSIVLPGGVAVAAFATALLL